MYYVPLASLGRIPYATTRLLHFIHCLGFSLVPKGWDVIVVPKGRGGDRSSSSCCLGCRCHDSTHGSTPRCRPSYHHGTRG